MSISHVSTGNETFFVESYPSSTSINEDFDELWSQCPEWSIFMELIAGISFPLTSKVNGKVRTLPSC